jgi:tetratricopeptide (TPR) repeat protein
MHANGQFEPNSQELHGRLIGGADFSYDAYVIELSNLTDRSNRYHTDVRADGNFVVRDLPKGDYMVRVLTLYDAEITTTMVSVGLASGGVPFEITLPQQKMQKPVSGTVSVQQLSHPLSKQERKLLVSGEKLADSQHYADAAARFREAVDDDPQSPQAHAELAMALSHLENWDGAIREFQAATALDPRNSVLHSNLASVLASANRAREAQGEAAIALKLDPSNARAHYVTAAVILHQPGHLEEAVSHLLAARDAFPPARDALERICAAAPRTAACAK